ncbi:phosphoenolpyruvate--protein phosphotransferase [Shewanella gelidii]|uniref:phosphoenolpyruvate--protein phosphotransferase n=1 Tax=Shewanella gelidii TaxID=1642821 RepID=A0A917JIM0_9GAMM|nr:phosphoenolpyruvate--protein phosphotransferase [Shewanella gelidii]MCL1096681.1 phosphoenolpyruvate--protein phosphotransferase [Shewanella gelidii]GGI69475.1 phosphoenolpyruvate--protein phosphotransferase [Shewanella gelidii]
MLNTLRDITQAVASAQSLDVALKQIVQRTKAAMLTQVCSVYLLDKHQVDQQELVLSATDGLDADAVGRVKMPLTEGLVGLVAQREEVVNLADARRHNRFKLFPEIAEEEYRAFLAAPIIYQKKALGVIVVQQDSARLFSGDEEAFLMTLAAQLAMALRGLKQKADVKEHQHQILFQGTSASNGIAIAHALVLGGEISLEQPQIQCTDIAAELKRLGEATERAKDAVSALTQRFDREQDDEVASIFSALLLLLDDASLGGEYVAEVKEGWSAETAVSRVSLRFIEQFSSMDDPYLKERASDIRDLGQRVLRQLIEPGRLEVEPDKPVVLVAREADTTLLAEFPRKKLAGIVTELGGVNSHAAILARALGVPAIVGVQQILTSDIDKQLVVVNASRGQLLVSPSASVIQEFKGFISAQKALQKKYAAEQKLKTETTDGCRVKLCVNAGLLSGIGASIVDGADGIGLYRTEIPFMLQQRFPSESEQIKGYQQVLSAAGGKPVVMRTLDVGGDKPLPYFPIKEENPFLGWRGIRLSLDHPEIFLVQIRAMLQAAEGSDQLQILLPMVSTLDEIDQALSYVRQAFDELKIEAGCKITWPKLGVMLEVPALLYQLDEVAKRVDFVSVGSNDLTQYLLAVDRNNPRVSSLFDSYHPGVLRALERACSDCQRLSLPISVCGELASEPIGAMMLVALGYDNLSMNQGALARINYLMRRLSLADLQDLLSAVLQQKNGEQVRSVAINFLKQKSLASILN